MMLNILSKATKKTAKIVLIYGLYFLPAPGLTQILSKFTWDNNPVTTAAIGPNATSVSGVATSSPGGMGGSNGLNAGTPATDIMLTIPGSPTFDVPGIELSIDFKRKESQGSFWTRGSSLDFGMNGGNLYVKFLVSNGAGGSTSINSGSIFAIPSDNAFHHYDFLYNNITGLGTVTVDGTVVYTYNGIAGRGMYWTGAGNVVVGTLMDGTGSNVTIMDNLIVQVPIVLPLHLLDFSGMINGSVIDLNWQTANEIATSYFIIERSGDGIHYSDLGRVWATNNPNSTNSYKFTDRNPLNGNSFYRLRMVGLNLQNSYSPIISFHSVTKNSNAFAYSDESGDLNIQLENISADNYFLTVYTMDGKIIYNQLKSLPGGSTQQHIPLQGLVAPFLFLRIENSQKSFSRTLKLVH